MFRSGRYSPTSLLNRYRLITVVIIIQARANHTNPRRLNARCRASGSLRVYVRTVNVQLDDTTILTSNSILTELQNPTQLKTPRQKVVQKTTQSQQDSTNLTMKKSTKPRLQSSLLVSLTQSWWNRPLFSVNRVFAFRRVIK